MENNNTQEEGTKETDVSTNSTHTKNSEEAETPEKEQEQEQENTVTTKPDEPKRLKIEKTKESTQIENKIKNNNFKGDVQFGDGNTIKKEIYNLYQDRHGLPIQLELIDPEKIKFRVEEESEKYISLLLNEHLLILNCGHDGIANSLKQTIAQNLVFETYIKQEVSFDEYDRSDILHLIEDVRKKTLSEKNEKLLLFIHDSRDNKNPTLLKGLRTINSNGKKDILNKLGDDIYIVYSTYHQNTNYLKDSLFKFHLIDAFKIYVQKYDIIESIIILIKRQREKGIWSSGEKEFLKDLDKIIEESDFNERITNKEKEKRIDFLSILKNKEQPLGRYVLLIATLFPELPPNIFRSYVSLLIQEKKKKLPKKKKISLLEIWEEDSDFILDDCGLEAYNNDNQYSIDFISSSETEKCEQILFKKFTLFVDKQARLLIAHQHLFTAETSVKLHKRIHPVIAKLTTYFKNYYGDELLKNWLLEIESQRKKTTKLYKRFGKIKSDRESVITKIKELQTLRELKDNENSLRQLRRITPIRFKQQHNELLEELQLIRFLFHKEEGLPENVSIENILEELYELEKTLLHELHTIISNYDKASHILNRNVYLFVDLLSTIHEKDEAKELIPNFFANAFKIVYRHYIIFRILTKFQIKNTSFHSLEYYKQSLAKNNKEVNKNAIDAFCELLLYQSSNFYTYLSEIKKWFPKISKAEKDLTKLEEQTLIVFLTILIEQKRNDENYINAKNSIESETYKALFENKYALQQELPFIISHLFNSSIFFEKKDDVLLSNTFQNTLIELITYWFRILKNVQKLNIEESFAEEKIQIVVTTILNVLTKEQFRKFISNLKENRYSYNKKIANSKHLKKEKTLRKERKYLIEFITLLTN